MSLTSRRFIPLFAISQALLVASVLGYLLAPYAERIPNMVAPVVATVVGLVWMIPYPIAPRAFHYLASDDNFPIETCNFIDVNQLSGNLFAHYRWGGYLNYRTDGRMKVYIDSRADTVYDDQTYLKYATVQLYKPGWIDTIENSGAQYILWPRSREGQQMSQLLNSGRWRLLYDDFISVLLVRTDQSLPEPLKATSDSAYRRLRDGIQNLEQRRYAEAESSFQSALDMMPDLEFACYSLAQVKSLQGNKLEARDMIEECQKRFPNTVKLKAYEEFLK
jgi:tetratricopeptide (TPR) repeat protein